MYLYAARRSFLKYLGSLPCFLEFTLPAFGNESSSIYDIIKKHGLSDKTTAILFDFDSKEVVSSHNHDLRLPLASVTKAVTAVYGLETIGSSYKFNTDLFMNGTLENGLLTGNLFLLGGGDPSLSTERLNYFAKKLKKIGLKEIKGNFFYSPGIIPEFITIDPKQLPEQSYNPGFSGLNLNENKVFFKWRRSGTSYDLSLTSDGRKPNFKPANIKISLADNGRAIYQYNANLSSKEENWFILRKALRNNGSRSLPVRFSAAFTANALKSLCSQKSISIPDPILSEEHHNRGDLVASLESDALLEIIKEMLDNSTNVTAEVIGLFAGRKWGLDFKSITESGNLMSSWFDYVSGTSGALMTNHSGLSGDSRVSASEFVKFLNREPTRDVLPQILKKRRLFGNQNKKLNQSEVSIVAKTGTMHFTRGLAGYIIVRGRIRASFAIFSADIEKRQLIGAHQLASPPGSKAWLRRSKAQENQVLSSWANTYL